MTTNTMSHDLALSILLSAAVKVRRRRSGGLKLTLSTAKVEGDLLEAVWVISDAGKGVKVLEGTSIYTTGRAVDGAQVYERRATPRNRQLAQVKVGL